MQRKMHDYERLGAPQIHRLESSPLVPQNVMVLGDKFFKVLIRVNEVL